MVRTWEIGWARIAVRGVFGVGLALTLTACGQTGAPRAAVVPNVDLTASTAMLSARAATLRDDAARRRHDAEAQFEAEKQRCYTRFFVNGCLADAKEIHLAAVRAARAAEAEAAAIEREVRRRRFDEKSQVKSAQ